MINYEIADSPFYLANKKHCEFIEAKLKTLNIDCQGFCNSFGYEVEARFMKNKQNWILNFQKHQGTRAGGAVPFNAHNYSGAKVIISGIDKKCNVSAGKSSLRRLLSSTELKNRIPYPYYVKVGSSTKDCITEELINLLFNEKISKFKINDGKLECVIHEVTGDPLKLIDNIEATLKNCE